MQHMHWQWIEPIVQASTRDCQETLGRCSLVVPFLPIIFVPSHPGLAVLADGRWGRVATSSCGSMDL
jgi:hypothetical protein